MASMPIRDTNPERDADQIVDAAAGDEPDDRHQRRGVAAPLPLDARTRAAPLRRRGGGRADRRRRSAPALNFFGERRRAASPGRAGAPETARRGIGSELYDASARRTCSTLGAKRAASMFDEIGRRGRVRDPARLARGASRDASTLDPRTVTERRRPQTSSSCPRPSSTRASCTGSTRRRRATCRRSSRSTRSPTTSGSSSSGTTRSSRAMAASARSSTARVAAVSLLIVNTEPDAPFNMFTGTGREYRGRGLALAVKLASTRWAAENGVTQIVTRTTRRTRRCSPSTAGSATGRWAAASST